ncbi:MAG: pilus assembly protein PilY, partial [Burkholderiales bacterium]|nr:pilus assembly protein PilY [Burkholderiales bacterium]
GIAGPAPAAPLNLTQVPLYLGTLVKPNVLVLLDNSESMDATMAGMLIAGSDPTTRSNIARTVLRNTVTSFQNSFNWGLGTFATLGAPALYTTYAYYLGDDTQMVYTNDCVGGISATNGGLRCVPNPEPAANGYGYITYESSGDDPSINDVLYTGNYGSQLYGIAAGGTNYSIYLNRNPGTGSSWNATDFGGSQGTWTFSPTDAGYLPSSNPPPPQTPVTRQLYLPRAWGYDNAVSGAGTIVQPVAPTSSLQVSSILNALAGETNNPASTEIKNAAVFTPLAGSIATAGSYFSNSLAGTTSPITQTCQRNFVLLATDGNPTSDLNGHMYSLADQTDTYNATTGAWTPSTAAQLVLNNITALRSIQYAGNPYDVQTYVIGLGDTVANPQSIANLNMMAAAGGTGGAYLAVDPAALAKAFNAISVDIVSKTSAASAVSVNSTALNTGTMSYQGRFNSGDWSGQLLAFPILASGLPASQPTWDSGQKLNAQNWNTGRQILTYKPSAALGSRGIAFRWPVNAAAPGAQELDPGMIAALNTSNTGVVDNYGSQRLPYLRGNTALEQRNCSGCAAPVFRNRPTSVLGDIVDSAPLYVNGPTASYRDNIAAAPYSAYATLRRSQPPMIYVGANDGMLHAFNAATGSEAFAYVPWAVASRLAALTDPGYTHQYTVDGSPTVNDVYYGGAWHSLLLGTMGAGAQGLFALDVSDPSLFTESNAARIGRWEVGNGDPDVGNIFSDAVAVPLRDGSWRVLVGNGYNSANGHAVLLMIDVQTGAISRIDTQAGSAGTPNGLSGLVTISSANNGVVDTVYAGDLYGNLWKFDLSSTSAANWKVAYSSAGTPAPLFTTASGQAITSRPDVTVTPAGQNLVVFGTGRYIDTSDNAAGAQQALYGIVDAGAPVTAAQLEPQAIVSTATSSSGATYRFTTHAVGQPTDNTTVVGDDLISVPNYWASMHGWQLPLSSGGERVVTKAQIRYGRVTFSTMIPNTSVCSGGGSGWKIEIDALTGNRSPAFDTNGDGTINAVDEIGGLYASGVQIGAIPAAATTIRSSNPTLDVSLVNTSNGTIQSNLEQGNQKSSRRASWEQIR